MRQALFDVYTALRLDPLTCDSTILIIPENNFGLEAHTIHELVKTAVQFDKNTEVLSEDQSKAGFQTGTQTKLDADDLLAGDIATERIDFYENLIVTNPAVTGTPAARRKFMKEKLLHQIEEIREYIKTSPVGRPVRMVSSTHDAQKKRISGNIDDIQRALSILIIVSHWFYIGKLDIDYSRIAGLRRKRRDITKDYEYVSTRFYDKKHLRPDLLQEIGMLTLE